MRAASGSSGDFFNTLGVTPLLGRLLTARTTRRGCAAPAAVLSYGFWQREFGGRPVGDRPQLQLDGHTYEIVGVTPAQFFGVEVGRSFDVAVPLCAEPLTPRRAAGLDKPDVWFLAVFGAPETRMDDGAGKRAAGVDLAADCSK